MYIKQQNKPELHFTPPAGCDLCRMYSPCVYSHVALNDSIVIAGDSGLCYSVPCHTCVVFQAILSPLFLILQKRSRP